MARKSPLPFAYVLKLLSFRKAFHPNLSTSFLLQQAILLQSLLGLFVLADSLVERDALALHQMD